MADSALFSNLHVLHANNGRTKGGTFSQPDGSTKTVEAKDFHYVWLWAPGQEPVRYSCTPAAFDSLRHAGLDEAFDVTAELFAIGGKLYRKVVSVAGAGSRRAAPAPARASA